MAGARAVVDGHRCRHFVEQTHAPLAGLERQQIALPGCDRRREIETGIACLCVIGDHLVQQFAHEILRPVRAARAVEQSLIHLELGGEAIERDAERFTQDGGRVQRGVRKQDRHLVKAAMHLRGGDGERSQVNLQRVHASSSCRQHQLVLDHRDRANGGGNVVVFDCTHTIAQGFDPRGQALECGGLGVAHIGRDLGARDRDADRALVASIVCGVEIVIVQTAEHDFRDLLDARVADFGFRYVERVLGLFFGGQRDRAVGIHRHLAEHGGQTTV